MLTLEMLQRLWPHGDTKVPGLIEGIAAAAPTVFPEFGLNSDLVIAHAMAQFSHECDAGLEMVAQATGFENAERMRRSFTRILGVTPQQIRRGARAESFG